MISQFILKPKIRYRVKKPTTGKRYPARKIKITGQKRYRIQDTGVCKQYIQRIRPHKNKKMIANFGGRYRYRHSKP